jgi:hypothetical protein
MWARAVTARDWPRPAPLPARTLSHRPAFPQPESADSARSLCDPGLTAAGYTAGFARCTLPR